MSKTLKNVDTISEILDIMHKEVVGALVNSQLTKDNSVANAVSLMTPAFDKFAAEDIKNAFMVFALNVAADALSKSGNQETGKVKAEEIVMTKPGQA